jgi:pSer/pThr/pTyr-binding forkhead associated (FHA) protein
MKIILGEDRGGRLLNERGFTGEAVLVGRDPAACHFFFEQNKWPMVSRKHAEFRFTDGRWIVADAGSRFGTFVNAQKITGPVEVRAGSHVQLGPDGPILRVVSIEEPGISKPETQATQIDHAPAAQADVAAAFPEPKRAPPARRVL